MSVYTVEKWGSWMVCVDGRPIQGICCATKEEAEALVPRVKARYMELPAVKLYKDKAGEYRWRLVAGNGQIVADSSEGYTRLDDVERAWGTVREIFEGWASQGGVMHVFMPCQAHQHDGFCKVDQGNCVTP